MTTWHLRRLNVYAVALTCLSSIVTGVDVLADPTREVVVMFRPEVIELPRSSIGAPLDSVVVALPALKNLLLINNVLWLEKANPSFDAADTLQMSRMGELVIVPDESNIYVVTLGDSSRADSLVAGLVQLSDVVFAERNGFLPPLECPPGPTPNDPEYQNGEQWNLNNCTSFWQDTDISVPEAWQMTKGSPNVKLAIVDHGIDRTHPDFQGRNISGGEGIDPQNPDHGTWVGGICAAVANNGEGICPVDWYSEIFNVTTITNFTSRGMGIEEADNYGSDIINMSFGGNVYSAYVHLKIARAYKEDRFCVTATDDDGGPDYQPHFPSDLHMTTAVTATDRLKNRQYNKSYKIDVAAPGYEVVTANRWDSEQLPGVWYAYVFGTSFAAPHVSGVAALMLAVDPNLSNDDIKGVIKASADSIGSADEFGAGKLNAVRALRMLGAPYSIVHLNASGGTPHGGPLPREGYYFVSYPGLAAGKYDAARLEIRKDVNFPVQYAITPAVWGRKTSVGCSGDSGHFNEGFCEPVPETITKFGCTLRTYVYDLWTAAGQHVGWIPNDPGQQTFKYSVLGIQDVNAPSPEISYPNGGQTFATDDQVTITWWVVDEYPIGTISNVYLVKVYGDGTEEVSQIASNLTVNSEGFGTYVWTVPQGCGTVSTLKIRVSATDTNDHIGSGVSESYFTINYSGYGGCAGGGPKGPIPCEAPCPETPPEKRVTALGRNAPNPFNPETLIPFSLARDQTIALRVYDVSGRLIRNLYEGEQKAEYYVLPWDGTDDHGEHQASGVYFAVLSTEDGRFVRKMVLLR